MLTVDAAEVMPAQGMEAMRARPLRPGTMRRRADPGGVMHAPQTPWNRATQSRQSGGRIRARLPV